MDMDIGRLDNLLNQSKLTNKKVEQPRRLTGSKVDSSESKLSEANKEVVKDSVSLSLEGLVKKTTMELEKELGSVRQGKVNELKNKISSGEYNVSSADIAKAIIQGRDGYSVRGSDTSNGVYEELK